MLCGAQVIQLQHILKNETPEENRHGDPQKAQNISKLLQGITVVIGRWMGVNITRIRKKFVPIISTIDSIEQALQELLKIIPAIIIEMEKPVGLQKKVLKLPKQ